MTEFDQQLQNDVINLLIWDKTFLSLVRDSLPSEFFTSSVISDICKICYNFHNKFNTTVGHHIETEIQEFIKKNKISKDQAELYYSYINKIINYEPNDQYVLKRLSTAIEYHAIKQALIKGSKLVKQGDIKQAKEILLDSFNQGLKDFQLGMSYADTHYTKTKQDKLVLPTMIPELDSPSLLSGGLKRQMFSIWLAPSNVGKTWALSYLAKCAVVYGVNTVYYTIGDDNEEGIKSRIDNSLAGPSYINHKDVKLYDFDGEEIDLELRNDEQRESLLESVKKSYLGQNKYGEKRGNVWIKQYASGECSPEDIESHLTQLSIREGFYPDVVLVDYIDEVVSRKNSKDERVNQLDVINKLKAIATNRNVHLCTASQTNRLAIDIPVITAKHMGEDIRKWQRADIVLGLCQTPEERKRNVMRISTIKNRHGKKDGIVEMLTSYELGQFCLESRWFKDECDG